MEVKLKTQNIMIIIMIIIIMSGLYRNFNFKNLKFEPFWQSVIYILALIIGVILLFRKVNK